MQAQGEIAEGRVRHERSLSDLSAMKQQLAAGTERCSAYEAELAEMRQRTAQLASAEAELATLRKWQQVCFAFDRMTSFAAKPAARIVSRVLEP